MKETVSVVRNISDSIITLEFLPEEAVLVASYQLLLIMKGKLASCYTYWL